MERTQIAALILPSHGAPDPKALAGVADPLAPIAGKSVLGWIVDAALAASVRRIGVVANNPTPATASEIAARSDDALIEFVTPRTDITETLTFAMERLGSELTLRDTTQVLLLPAESPQIDPVELQSLVTTQVTSGAAATLLASAPQDDLAVEPLVVRNAAGEITSILDVSGDVTGIMCIRAALLVPALRRVVVPGWQTGAPLAEIAGVLDELGHVVNTLERDEPIASIRSAATRTPIEMALRDRIISGWIDRGTDMIDPRQVTIDATVHLGQGVQIHPGSVLEGHTIVGDGAAVGPNTHLIDASVGTRASVPHSVVRAAEIAAHAQVHPFSVISNGTR